MTDDVNVQRPVPHRGEQSRPQRRDDINDPRQEDAPKEPTITLKGEEGPVTLTMSQYEEYIEQQLAWLESLPPITPDDPLYKEWIGEEDLDDAPRRLRAESE